MLDGRVERLAVIGAAPDPIKTLADMRAGAAHRMRKMRAKQKEGVSRDTAALWGSWVNHLSAFVH